MKKLELKKLASDIAFSTVTQTLSSLDAAASAKGSELKLTDQEYQLFRNDALQVRGQYLTAYQADQNAAKLAAPKTPAAPPAK